jgi:hypothetical protein
LYALGKSGKLQFYKLKDGQEWIKKGVSKSAVLFVKRSMIDNFLKTGLASYRKPNGEDLPICIPSALLEKYTPTPRRLFGMKRSTPKSKRN